MRGGEHPYLEIAVVSTPGLIMKPEKDFLGSLSLSSQPSVNLFKLYQGWLDKVSAMAAASVTGKYSIGDAWREDARRAALAEWLKPT